VSSSYLDFFLDFGSTGRIFGVGVGSGPDEWSAVLGDEFTDFLASDHELARQFGLIDAYFSDISGDWLCSRISIRPGQLYRFDDWVPGTVRERYGQFPGRVPFDEVADRLAQAGVEVDHVARTSEASLEDYWIPASGVSFGVLSAYQADDFPALRIGDVWSAGAFAGGYTVPPERRVRYR
jgi:hypothetical protein